MRTIILASIVILSGCTREAAPVQRYVFAPIPGSAQLMRGDTVTGRVWIYDGNRYNAWFALPNPDDSQQSPKSDSQQGKEVVPPK